jgi:hypothetical protein
MTTMTTAEKQSFMAGLHVGVLSIARDGLGPLTVPVWYDYEPGGQLWFITGPDSLKGKLLSEGTRISMCSQTEDAPYKYVSIEGPVVSMGPSDGEGLPMAIRYLGAKMGTVYHSQSAGGADVLVHVKPENWLAVDYSKANPLG